MLVTPINPLCMLPFYIALMIFLSWINSQNFKNYWLIIVAMYFVTQNIGVNYTGSTVQFFMLIAAIVWSIGKFKHNEDARKIGLTVFLVLLTLGMLQIGLFGWIIIAICWILYFTQKKTTDSH